jgi:hypothetical protein
MTIISRKANVRASCSAREFNSEPDGSFKC